MMRASILMKLNGFTRTILLYVLYNLTKPLFCWNQIDFLGIFQNKIAIGLFRLVFTTPLRKNMTLIYFFRRQLKSQKLRLWKGFFLLKLVTMEIISHFHLKKKPWKFCQGSFLFALFVFFHTPPSFLFYMS